MKNAKNKMCTRRVVDRCVSVVGSCRSGCVQPARDEREFSISHVIKCVYGVHRMRNHCPTRADAQNRHARSANLAFPARLCVYGVHRE